MMIVSDWSLASMMKIFASEVGCSWALFHFNRKYFSIWQYDKVHWQKGRLKSFGCSSWILGVVRIMAG